MVQIFEMPWALMQAVCIVLSIPYSLHIANAAEVGDFAMRCPLLSRFVLQCASIFPVVATIVFGPWIL